MNLQTRNLTVGYEGRAVLHDLTLTLPAGRVSAILGPNGCGKSTLLKTLARLIRPRGGEVLLAGKPLRATPDRALARQMAILPQAPVAPEGITVADLVRRGRLPWRGLLGPWRDSDARACEEALAAVDLTAMAELPLAALSGGQRQRAWIALVLAQTPQCLLLDEPTTFLDLVHQVEILRLLRRLNAARGMTVVSVLHDMGLAARFSDHLLLLGPDGPVAEGPPATVLTEANLKQAFGLEAVIHPDPVSGTPMVIPR